jgi:hypothetical protein
VVSTLLTVLLFLSGRGGDDGFRDDFERPVLEGWDRVASDLHPPYNVVELVRDPGSAKSGSQFVRFQSLGGFTALRRPLQDACPVDSTRAYRMTAYARLQDTRSDGASLSLTWVNGDGDVVAVTRSEPVRQTGNWVKLALDVAHVPEGAIGASPGLEFGGDDVRGRCDFDQVVLEATELIELEPVGRTSAVFDAGESPRFTLWLVGAAPGIHRVSVVLSGDAGVGERRIVVLTIPDEAKVEVAFAPVPPGAHELVASLDGQDGERRFPVLIPNPWVSAVETPFPAIAGSRVPPDNLPGLLSIAKLSLVPGEARIENGPLELVLRRRIAEPESPVALDRLFIGPKGEPTNALLALRAVNDLMAGAVPMPSADLFPAQVRVAAFRKGDTAAMALWCDTGAFDLPLNLNPGALLYPPLGTCRPLRSGEILHLEGFPLFIMNVEPLFLELALSLSPPVLPLQFSPTTCTLGLRNPSTQAMGDIQVKFGLPPAGATISPRTQFFPLLGPKAALSQEVQIQIPAPPTERDLPLEIEVRFTRRGQEYVCHFVRVLRIQAALRIEADVRAGPRPGSKVVTAWIQNSSDRTMCLTLRVRLPGLPEQMELVRNLAPGARSAAFEYLVKDVLLLDPSRRAGEIEVQEPMGARAVARRRVDLR